VEFGGFGPMTLFFGKNKNCAYSFNYFIILGFLLVFIGCSGSLPASIGDFASCPESPNCVSTKSSSQEHGIKPFNYSVSKEKAKQGLLEIVKKMPGTKIKINQDNLVHSEFTSSVFRFVDDVEFYFEEDGVINFRSASRLGHSDLGANRNRMEEIRKQFATVSGVK
jgi:uncharacterized protein (DUF1499 family)